MLYIPLQYRELGGTKSTATDGTTVDVLIRVTTDS